MKNRGLHLAVKLLDSPKSGALQNYVRPGEGLPIDEKPSSQGQVVQETVNWGLPTFKARKKFIIQGSMEMIWSVIDQTLHNFLFTIK